MKQAGDYRTMKIRDQILYVPTQDGSAQKVVIHHLHQSTPINENKTVLAE